MTRCGERACGGATSYTDDERRIARGRFYSRGGRERTRIPRLEEISIVGLIMRNASDMCIACVRTLRRVTRRPPLSSTYHCYSGSLQTFPR